MIPDSFGNQSGVFVDILDVFTFFHRTLLAINFFIHMFLLTFFYLLFAQDSFGNKFFRSHVVVNISDVVTFSHDSLDDHFFQSHVFVDILNVFTCSWKQSPFVFINGGGGGQYPLQQYFPGNKLPTDQEKDHALKNGYSVTGSTHNHEDLKH